MTYKPRSAKSLNLKKVEKRVAHLANIEVWRNLSGRRSFLDTEEYWTLIHHESTEIGDVLGSGLISSLDNFHGINNDKTVFEECRRKYPEVKLHFGDWHMQMHTLDPCPSGGIVYLDTMTQVDERKHKAASWDTVFTLRNCGPGTLVCANFCIESPREGNRKLDIDLYQENLIKSLGPDGNRWRMVDTQWSDQEDYKSIYLPPKTNYTQMGTFFYWSER